MKDVNLAMVPDARVGEYVLVNMGSAVHTMDEAEAQELTTDDIVQRILGAVEVP